MTKRLVALLLMIACALPMSATTKLLFRQSISPVNPTDKVIVQYYGLATTQGTGLNGRVATTIAGPVSSTWPVITDMMTALAGTTHMLFISGPLASSTTISGTITPNLWCKESATSANATLRYQVLRWSVKRGGIVSSLGASTDNGAAECGTTAAAITTPTLTPTSTTFDAGDRIVVIVYFDDGSGVTMASGKTITFDVNGITVGADGDSYLTFTETFTVNSDTNNAPAQGYTGN